MMAFYNSKFQLFLFFSTFVLLKTNKDRQLGYRSCRSGVYYFVSLYPFICEPLGAAFKVYNSAVGKSRLGKRLLHWDIIPMSIDLQVFAFAERVVKT